MAGPDDRPLMILARVGEGRVAQLMSDHAWLWARGYDGGGPQAEALRRMAHWLMKEPQLEEEALGASQIGAALVIQRNTMQDEAGDVTVTMPSGKTETVKLSQALPGIWRGEIEATEAGVHRLSDGTQEAVAAVGSPDPRETTDLIATTSLLEPLAGTTRGASQFMSGDGTPATLSLPRLAKVGAGRDMAGPGWIGLKSNGAYRVLSIGSYALFSTLLALAALLALLSMMWYREGR